jgi:Mn2+/Fe2+ NRAMP family transporter
VIATFFNVAFVSLILYCVLAMQRTDYAIGLADLVSGFSLKLPPDTLILALTAFGITGISAGEIFVYPNWCIEKGYAAWTGPRDDSTEWAERARGWMRVMTWDAVVSMVVYTVATVAFYLLGAAVLEPQGAVADGQEVVWQLSRISTEVLGQGTAALFMLGAFMVLLSTLFANVAGHSRLWTDCLGIWGLRDAANPRERRQTLAVLAWILPFVWAVTFIATKKTIALVIVLGVTNTFFLVVVAYQALVFRYRNTEKRLAPSLCYDALLWVSILTIAVVAVNVAWDTYLNTVGG